MKIRNMYLITFCIALIVSFMGVFIYPNFFLNYFKISPNIIYILFIIFCFLDKVYKTKKRQQMVSHYWLVLFTLSYLILNFTESLTYDNFIFSKLHIHPKQFVYPLFVVVAEFMLNLNIKNTKESIKYAFLKLFNYRTLVLPFVALILFNNFFETIAKMRPDISFLIKNFAATIDERYKYKLGDQFYDYSQFIKNNTDNNSNILVPPFPAYPWPQTGNAVYFRYFLYPRTLSSGEEYDPKKNLQDFDYVLIAWGETPTTSSGHTHGWPKFNVDAEYILLLQKNGDIKKIDGDYVYKKYLDNETWGLIKVKKKI